MVNSNYIYQELRILFNQMNDLRERLLSPSRPQQRYIRMHNNPNSDRYSLRPDQMQPSHETSFQIESEEIADLRLYHSIIEDPEPVWNQQQILQRGLILQELDQPVTPAANSRSEQTIKSIGKTNQISEKKKSLNLRLFHLKSKPRLWIYYYNYFFNLLFRIGLVVLLVELIIEGDGDKNEEEQRLFIKILLGLEGLVALLYFLALTKFLFTKSCDISVYFQKQFYELPYSQIHMQRILRKHFTVNKILSNLFKMINPFTKFSKDIRISLICQQIYKRIEMVIVFAPLLCVFLLGTPWLDPPNQTKFQFDVKLLIAIIVCMEGVHIILHYLFLYIFS